MKKKKSIFLSRLVFNIQNRVTYWPQILYLIHTPVEQPIGLEVGGKTVSWRVVFKENPKQTNENTVNISVFTESLGLKCTSLHSLQVFKGAI